MSSRASPHPPAPSPAESPHPPAPSPAKRGRGGGKQLRPRRVDGGAWGYGVRCGRRGLCGDTPVGSEKVLWEALRDRRLDGVRFKRQAPIDRFVVDFFAPSARLVIEVDGSAHAGREDSGPDAPGHSRGPRPALRASAQRRGRARPALRSGPHPTCSPPRPRFAGEGAGGVRGPRQTARPKDSGNDEPTRGRSGERAHATGGPLERAFLCAVAQGCRRTGAPVPGSLPARARLGVWMVRHPEPDGPTPRATCIDTLSRVHRRPGLRGPAP